MSHAIQALSSPSFLLPAAKASLTKAMAGATAASSSTSGSTTSAAGTTDLGTTFLNLLSTELQNQDPTAPVDSTAMVGQMISLNQLDQLISIKQSLTGSTTSTTKPASSSSASSAAALTPASSAAQSGALNPASILASTQAALPFDPNTLMPLTTSTSTANTTSITGAK